MQDAIDEFLARNSEFLNRLYHDIRETAGEVAHGTVPGDDAEDLGVPERTDREFELRKDLILMVTSILLSDLEDPFGYARRYIPAWAEGVVLPRDPAAPAPGGKG